MNPQKYFDYMRETTLKTESLLEKKLSGIHSKAAGTVTAGFLSRKNTQRPKIRPGIVRLGYEISGGRNWEEILPVCAAFELLNISTYTINMVFDEKGGSWDNKKRNNHVIAGMIQREIAQELLTESIQEKNYGSVKKINKIFSDGNKTTYFGQFIDLNALTIKERLTSEKEYLEEYLERNYFFGGKFYEQALVVGSILANAGKEQIDALSGFGKYFGTSLQITNDVGDFIPPDRKPYAEAFKIYQDQFGDLRQGKLTLPIYLTLKNSSSQDKKFVLNQVGKNRIEPGDGYKLTNIMVKSGAMEECKKLVNSYVRTAKKHLNIFPDSEAKSLLSATTSNARSSCYWKILKEIAQQINGAQYHKT